MSFLKRTRLIALLLASTSLSAVGKPPSYPGRAVFMQAYKKNCFNATALPDKMPEKLEQVRRAFNRMKKSPTIGAPLAAFAESRGDLLYCTGITPYDGNTFGIFNSDNGSIRLWSEEETAHTPDEIAGVSVHETHHGMQYDVMPSPLTTWSIYDAQTHHLFREAAARTTENLFIIDLVQNEENVEIHTDRAQKYALDAFNDGIDKNMVYSRALQRAGEMTFAAMLKEADFLNSYNDDVLAHYLQHIDTPPVAETGITLEGVRQAGYITDDFNFTANVKDLPKRSSLFGGSKRMRQAFAYAEYQRWVAVEGESGPHAAPLYTDMVNDNNPYRGLDREQVRAALAKNQRLMTLSVMNRVAGLKP